MKLLALVLALTAESLCAPSPRRNKTETPLSLGNADCPEYGEVPHATVTKINVNNVRGVHVECKEGYDLVDRSKTVFCNNGQWDNNPKPECAKRCQRPPFLRNAEVRIEGRQDEQETYRQGTQALYKCADGLQLRPANSWMRRCVGGVWSGLQGTCVSNGCPPPPNITNGYHVLEKTGVTSGQGTEGTSVGVEERVHYNCNFGYTIDGPTTLQCIAEGYWNPRQPPKCVRGLQSSQAAAILEVTEPSSQVCPPASSAPHTEVSALDGPQTANNAGNGARLELTCSDGYRDEMSPCTAATLFCEDGVWKGRFPKCVPAKECLPPPDIPHGSLSPLPNTASDGSHSFYEIGSEVTYSCLPDFVMVGEPVLKCSSSGCWEPSQFPSCHPDTQLYVSPRSLADYLSTSSILLVSMATALGVTLILLGVCVVVVCRHRAPKVQPPLGAHHHHHHHRGGRNQQHQGRVSPASSTGAGTLHDPDRVALIAFADGAQLGDCSALPSYEEAVRERGVGGGILSGAHRIHSRTHWGGLVAGRRPIHVTRQSSSTSHSAGDSMGSTDTMAPSEVSTTVTLDTVSSHTCSSGSQSASCRAICGSLASFDTSSALNTEGVPLLEESELEDIGASEVNLCKHRRLSPDPVIA